MKCDIKNLKEKLKVVKSCFYKENKTFKGKYKSNLKIALHIFAKWWFQCSQFIYIIHTLK